MSQPAGFAWAVMPPNPELEAEMLSRLMSASARRKRRRSRRRRRRGRRGRARHARAREERRRRVASSSSTIRSTARGAASGLALDRTGFTVVDRDRSTGIYFVRYADPDADMAKKDREKGFLSKLLTFWKTDEKDKPEQYRIKVVETAPQSTRQRAGSDRRAGPHAGERASILALLRDQLK